MARKSDFTIKLESKELDRQLAKAMQLLPGKTVQKVRGFLLMLAGRSAHMAPIESGDLRNDCTATLNGTSIYKGQKAIGAVPSSFKAFGEVGYSLPYALKQHEDLTLRHDRVDGYHRADGSTVNMVAGGEAKFLETPFNELAPKLEAQLAQIVSEVGL